VFHIMPFVFGVLTGAMVIKLLEGEKGRRRRARASSDRQGEPEKKPAGQDPSPPPGPQESS
jgi:hypothetical protein